MQTRIARLVVSRTTAGGIAVREPAPSSRLLGYTAPFLTGWAACVRAGATWAAQTEATAEAAEKALRAELRMPERDAFCPICEEETGGPWCDGTHPELAVIEADVVDVTFGGGR